MKKHLLTFLILSSSWCMAQEIAGNMKVFAFRLKPHEDVKKALAEFAKQNNIKAGCIISAVGSLEQFNLRFANQESGVKKSGHFEVVSFTGTFSDTAAHLHMSIADGTGLTTGGHLLDENLVYTTMEIVVGEITNLEFQRLNDPTYGYPELVVKPRPKNK